MSLELVEAASFSKTGDETLNEDAYAVEDGVIAVFDGETNKGAPVIPTPGRRAALALAEAARNLPRACDPMTIVKSLQEAVASVSGPDASTAAVGAVLDVHSRRLTRVGDVTVGIGGKFHFQRKLLDEVAAASRAALLRTLLLSGCTLDELRAQDPGRQMILPLLRAGVAWRNRVKSAYGFASLDGGTTPAEMIDVFEIPAGAEVIIATDGYCDPRPTLRRSEEVLACLIAEDPLRLGPPPGTKAVLPDHVSFDDRTYVRVRL